MKIGIDMFGAQTADHGSATGHYARNLVHQLTARFPRHDYFLYLHEGVGDVDEAWSGRGHIRRVPSGGAAGSRPNGQFALERCLDAVDVWLATATVEQVEDYLPPGAPLDGPRLAGLVCDLAPAMVPDRFLRLPDSVQRCGWALDALRRYDLLLTVSDATRRECTRFFNISDERVVAIGAAGDPHFFVPNRAEPLPLKSRAVLESLGVSGAFVLCQAGDDENRSMEVLMTAIARLDATRRCAFQFVIACKLNAHQELRWKNYIRHQGLTTRVLLIKFDRAQTARLLYQRCEVFVDASPHEGSGLALVHALECGAAAIVGRSSSHADLAGDAALLTDVDQADALAAKLGQALGDPWLLRSLRCRAPRAVGKLAREAAADRAMAAIEGLANRPVLAARKRFKAQTRLPMAFFSPLLPIRTGIADYSERLLAALKRFYRIDLYHDENYLPQLGLSPSEFTCRNYRVFDRFRRAVDYAGIVYQMANTHYCGFVYETLLRHPGVVVLHDHSLPEFHFGYASRSGVAPNFIADEIALESAELGDEYGACGEAWASEAGGVVQACFRRGLTFNQTILRRAALVIVHDRWGAEQISRTCPHLAERLRIIPHGASVYEVSPERKHALRRRFGFSDETLILSCFGMLNGLKYHGEAIEALAAIVKDYPSARLLFVGGDLNDGREQAKADALGLTDHVRFFEYPPMETFLELTSITDVGINLRRPPTRGETSGALLTLLSAGVPTIVTDVDAFSSYPDTVVQKIGPLGPGDRTLERTLRRLLDRPETRRQLGQAAMRHVKEVHNWSRVAALYAEAIEEFRRMGRDPTAEGRRQPSAPLSSTTPYHGNTAAIR